MQIFMPYADFEKSAKCLDYKRLGKRRVEAMQIHHIVSGPRAKGGWLNHPAIKMWSNQEDALAAYHNAMLNEWMYRGYINNMPKLPHSYDYIIPPFIGDKKFHDSHKSNLWFSLFQILIMVGLRENVPCCRATVWIGALKWGDTSANRRNIQGAWNQPGAGKVDQLKSG